MRVIRDVNELREGCLTLDSGDLYYVIEICDESGEIITWDSYNNSINSYPSQWFLKDELISTQPLSVLDYLIKGI